MTRIGTQSATNLVMSVSDFMTITRLHLKWSDWTKTDTESTPRTRIDVKVVPGSLPDLIVGWLGELVEKQVVAPPKKKALD
jgi:hypothetical protein